MARLNTVKQPARNGYHTAMQGNVGGAEQEVRQG
jgi:hypothetical protein